MNPPELPENARRAFENYPRIEASPAFNRAVLQSLETAQSARKLTLIGRVEEMLGLKWWQFAASGLLGAFLPAIVLGVLLLSNRGAPPDVATPPSPLLPRALIARELWRPREPLAPIEAPAKPPGEEFSCVLKFPLV